MLFNQRIDIVAPPFGGHLHPQLDLANKLRSATDLRVHVLSTPSAQAAIEACGFPYTLLLQDREHIILGIANTTKRVGANPFRLWDQLSDNLSLMDQLVSELRARWEIDRPDLVIVDFAVPVAGLLAQRMGIPWWTAIRAPTVIDTPDGVPPYLGGLRPLPGRLGTVRDAVGRAVIRTFKRTTHFVLRSKLRRLGIPSVYRKDGYEQIYSPERLLIQGVREFEFDCTWPPATRFIGPLTGGPPYPHDAPPFVEGKPHVLVSLGTHVRWAKDRAAKLIQEVAQRMPQVEFHFTRGITHKQECVSRANYHELPYVSYEDFVPRYAASINHAGSGIMYSCLRAGVPILAWPQDFDQFDNTARLLHHGLGLRCRPKPELIAQDLRSLFGDPSIQKSLVVMQDRIASYDTSQLLVELLEEQFREG